MKKNEEVQFEKDQFVEQLFFELESRVKHYEGVTEAAIPRIRLIDTIVPFIITCLITLGFILAIN
jgi:hypothetical protein